MNYSRKWNVISYDCHSLPKAAFKSNRNIWASGESGMWFVGVAIEMHVNRPIRVTVEIDKRSVCFWLSFVSDKMSKRKSMLHSFAFLFNDKKKLIYIRNSNNRAANKQQPKTFWTQDRRSGKMEDHGSSTTSLRNLWPALCARNYR